MPKVFVIMLANELRGFLRSRVATFWIFLFPVFLFTVMLMAFGRQGSLGPVPIDIVDLDGSSKSVEFHSFLERVFAAGVPVKANFASQDAGASRISGHVQLIVPDGFAAALSAGEPVDIVLRGDPGSGAATRATIGILEGAFTRFSIDAQHLALAVRPRLEPAADGRGSLEYGQFLVVGVLIMSIMSTGVISTATVLTALREQHALKMFACLPLRLSHFVLAIIAARLIIIASFSLTFFAVAKYLYGVDLDLWSVAGANAGLLIIVGAAMFLALGLLLGSRLAHEPTAVALCNLVYFPMLFLGDLTIPLADFPVAMKHALSYLPVNEFAQALRGVLFQAAPLSEELYVIFGLAAWTATFLTAAGFSFRWRGASVRRT